MGSGIASRLELGVELEKAVFAKGGTREDIVLVLEKRPDALEQCADLIVGAARETRNRFEFSIAVTAGETFDGLIAAGKYDWKWDGITEKRFPVRKSDPGERKLVLLRFGRNMSSEDAITEAGKQRLERPTYEDCLRFGAQHPEVQRQFPVVFLHTPVRVDGGPLILCLNRHGSERGLHYGWFDDGWFDIDRFAFVRK